MTASAASPRRVLVTGVLIGSVTTLLTTWAIHKFRKSKKESEQGRRKTNKIPLELREEQLSRHTLYFGSEGMQRLQNARICVVGLGGVGSHTAHMLARAGVGKLRLIDFDQVTLSSLNRHACATLADVGIPKAVCLLRYLQQICPDPDYLQIEILVEMYTAESGERLLQLEQGQHWDMVIDAIDDVPTKAELLSYCLSNNIRVLSCMGAGGKSDVTRLHISDLRTAAKDPLASKLRQALKKLLPNREDYMDNMEDLAIVYSSEKTVVKLADFTPEQKESGVHHYGAVDGMRIRVLPVLGTMPAVMGQTLAAMALTELGGKPFQPVTGERVGKNVRNKLFQHLRRREELITKKVLEEAGQDKSVVGEKGNAINGTWIGPIQVDQDDMEYLMEVWRNRCAVTGDRLGTVLHLVRWDLKRPATCDNLVLVSVNALEYFDDLDGKERISSEIRKRIEQRLAACKVDW